ncbi:MAG: magnesium transporter [Chlorobiota bacterium]
MLKELLKPEIEELLQHHRWNELREAIADWSTPEIADLLLDLDKEGRVLLFRALPRWSAAEVFSHLEPAQQDALLRELTDQETRELLRRLSPDDRTALLEEMPSEVTRRLLALLEPEDFREASFLLGFPEQSVGRLMTPEFVALRPYWTVREALKHIRRYGRDSETLNHLYVTDDDGRLLGELPLRTLVLADEATVIADIMNYAVVSLSAFDDRESAVHAMRKYDVSVLPVVDSDGVLLGIVTFDDVMDVSEEEVTEDFQKISAVAPIEISYREASVFRLWRRRIGWLLLLLVSDFLTATVIATYEHALQVMIALSFFIPMIVGTGGNVATQSSTLIIRALALREVGPRDWLRVLAKELAVSVLLGVVLAFIVWLRGFFWRGGPEVALVVGLSMFFIVIWSNAVAALFPIGAKRIGIDPALISGPFLTTFIDVTGLLIYFNVAEWILGLRV